MNLSIFQDKPFIDALKDFFRELKVPVNYVADEPTTAKELLGKDDGTVALMDDVYFLGMVDDAAFEGNTFQVVDEIKFDYDGILIFGVKLKKEQDSLPSKSQLAEISRAFNKQFHYTPVVIVFEYIHKQQRYLAFSNTERAKYKQEWREGEKVGRVVMLKDVKVNNTHSAHLRILFGDKSLAGLKIDPAKIDSFHKLYNYWQSVFKLQSLNDQFYADLQDWFYYALQNIKLPFRPDYIDEKENTKNFLVRLLARIMFCWFVKEKGLIQNELLELEDWEGNRFKLTNDVDDKDFLKSNSYYRGILQNIFFNALNRKEKTSKKDFKWTSYLHSDFNMDWLTSIPYLNGGIFDRLDEDNAKESIEDSVIKIPNFLFYGIEKKEKVVKGKGANARTETIKVEHKGLNGILRSYKFTLDENTPFEEDIALDPEMLGLVFENLLAELDPNLEESVKTSIRKLTGSYYTPRKVILEMVNDSLFIYLSKYLEQHYADKINNPKKQVADLVYHEKVEEGNTLFNTGVVQALDKYRVLDPACGSGAFPMVMLHRLVDILRLVDDQNQLWLELKLQGVDKAQKAEFKKVLTKHLDDYGRKLGIIRDSIYGVDIQPLAVQITKLRFFISLLIDQKIEKGITPMPNIETKIICADSLKNIQADFFSSDAIDKLTDARTKYYQPDMTLKERELITEEIASLLDQAFPAFSQQVTGKRIAGQNKVLLKEWFAHGTLAAPFFNMDFFYPELKDQGFDCVLGNPPYGGTKIPDNVRTTLDIESKDPYGAFIARFLNDYTRPTPLKHEGVLAFIVSDTFMTIKSHLPLRKKLMQNYVHKMIRVHPDTFRATVNTVIMIAERNAKKEYNDQHICLMADMTNLSIHTHYEQFTKVLGQTRGVAFAAGEKHKQVSNEEYAIYYYPQALIRTNTNLPFFVASPKLFALMNDGNDKTNAPKTVIREVSEKQVQVRQIPFNSKAVEIVKLGDVGTAPHGISTGNNKKYVRVKPGAKGSYDFIEDYMICPENELKGLSDDEKTQGLNKDWNSLKGCFVPFEKGGESDSDDGWLPNYYVPTVYYINWAKGAIADMKNNPGSAWKNEKYFFKKGLTFSISGIYAPTFRLNSGGVFEAKGSGLFCNFLNENTLLGLMSSKLAKAILKNFIKHSVDTSGDDIASFILLIIDQELSNKIDSSVSKIIANQKLDSRYDYASHEQIEIDKLVYEAYGLNADDILEVENWYARRYPKLSAAQKANLRRLGKSDDYLELYGYKKTSL